MIINEIKSNREKFFFSLGWPQAKVTAALYILERGSSTQRNKLMTEVAPQFRSMWAMS